MSAGLRTILITGVTRGLGRALAREFVRGGHTLIGCGRRRAELDTLARELAKVTAEPAKAIAELETATAGFDTSATRLGPRHDLEIVDIADDAAVERWARRVLARHGAPDLLVNNAGVMNDLTELWRIPAREFDRVLDVNVKGTANVIRHFVPAMVARGRGVIVNMSSGWGRSTDARVAPYCASKFAVEGLTQALAQELPPGLCAVALSPGVVDTDMLRQCWADDAASSPKPEAWARKAASFLLALGPRDNGKSLDVTA